MYDVAAGPGSSGRVLLAEDHPVNQRVTTAMLQHLGYHVDVVASGVEAVQAATLIKYRAIFMDCQLPVLDGYEATREIRRLQGASDRTPIIAVTGSDLGSDRERCLAAGMDGFLTKPLSLKSVSVVLARWDPNGSGLTVDEEAVETLPAGHDGPTPVAHLARPTLDPQVVDRLQRLGRAARADLLGQLSYLFLADAGARIVALHAALAAQDADALARSAHTLSGAGANLGATDLVSLCATLASAGRDGDMAGAGRSLEGIEAELERVRSALGAAGAPG